MPTFQINFEKILLKQQTEHKHSSHLFRMLTLITIKYGNRNKSIIALKTERDVSTNQKFSCVSEK